MENYLVELGTRNPVVIFSKTTCCMSYVIITLIRSFGASPVVYELDDFPHGRQMEKTLMGLGCDLPAVFIGKEFVGGSNEIMSLNIKGKLKPLLLKASAIWM
ncbi:hypothetical protein CASFOL_029140 [Castilleja foliolosa]|uniref:Glutaredoxin domain-containing protein n=1 Tax=Castilleja foliolosa TaxID=1961234 RepID=A0ABD3CE12_9LAMI